MMEISKLELPCRIEILRHLAVDDNGVINLPVFDSIAHDELERFYAFCEDVFLHKNNITSVTCEVVNGTLQYSAHE